MGYSLTVARADPAGAAVSLARRTTRRPSRHVLRLCSVFEPRGRCARGDAARYDPIGGMQNHTAELTRGLDRLGVRQHVLTSRLGGRAARARLGRAATVVRTGAPHARRPGSSGRLARCPRAVRRRRGPVGLVHAHQGEDLAVLPLAELVARAPACRSS